MKCSQIQKPETQQKAKVKETTREFRNTMAGDSSPKIGKQSQRDLNGMDPNEWRFVRRSLKAHSGGCDPKSGPLFLTFLVHVIGLTRNGSETKASDFGKLLMVSGVSAVGHDSIGNRARQK